MLDKKSVCVITGASKGLGRCIAENLSKKLPPGSRFILLSRSANLLDEVSAIVSSRDGIQSITCVFDQGSLDQAVFDDILKDSLEKICPNMSPNHFEQAILINNAGSLEPVDFVKDNDNVSLISSYFNINLAGCYAITSKFLQIFNTSVVEQRVIVNISSLAAVAPMKSWSLYCMGKAARDMFMKVLASEDVKIRTLSYAPGPLRTDMTDLASKTTKDSDLKNWFLEQIKGQKLLECEVTTNKLLDILSKDSFENGAHIDFYDEIS